MLLAASCRLVASGVDSNPHAFMTDSLFLNVIMALWWQLVFSSLRLAYLLGSWADFSGAHASPRLAL